MLEVDGNLPGRAAGGIAAGHRQSARRSLAWRGHNAESQDGNRGHQSDLQHAVACPLSQFGLPSAKHVPGFAADFHVRHRPRQRTPLLNRYATRHFPGPDLLHNKWSPQPWRVLARWRVAPFWRHPDENRDAGVSHGRLHTKLALGPRLRGDDVTSARGGSALSQRDVYAAYILLAPILPWRQSLSGVQRRVECCRSGEGAVGNVNNGGELHARTLTKMARYRR